MNEMERHWKSHHEDRLQKGEKVSYKIPSKGIINLDKYFSKTKKKKDEVEESVEIDGEEIGEDDATQLEVVEEEVMTEVKAADTMSVGSDLLASTSLNWTDAWCCDPST